MAFLEKPRTTILKFAIYGEEDGPLTGRRKILHRVAIIYADFEANLFVLELQAKALFGRIVRWILGM